MKNLSPSKLITNAFICFALLLLASSAVQAQKNLPNKQANSLRAPADIKTDGKTTEWGGKYKAYNHATQTYYTICNDDEKLYLTIGATDPDVLTKITTTGVVFTVVLPGQKSDKDAASVTFPYFDLKYGRKPYIQFSNIAQLRVQREAGKANPDSLSKVANRRLHDAEKFIRTSNLNGIDTLIGIYEKIIEVAENFDNTMAYTYELAVPLKYLNLQPGKAIKFAYHIVIPGINVDRDYGFKMTKRPDGVMELTMAPGAIVPTKEHLQVTMSTTDFWGEYTLADK